MNSIRLKMCVCVSVFLYARVFVSVFLLQIFHIEDEIGNKIALIYSKSDQTIHISTTNRRRSLNQIKLELSEM